MAEICTPPAVVIDPNGDEWVSFGPHHSLADVVRWLMQNPDDGQTAFDLLYVALEEIEDKKAIDKARRLC